MTQEQHPITPTPELVQKWITEGRYQDYCSTTEYTINQAARWGWEQRNSSVVNELQEARHEELEACVEWVVKTIPAWAAHREVGEQLRAARRPPTIPETVEVDGHTYRLVK